MAANALIKLSQLALMPPAGEALKGVAGVPVNIENGDNTGVVSYRVSLVYTPPGGSVLVGVLAQADGPVAPSFFVPDSTEGCYRVMLEVFSGLGQTGIRDVDIRNFALPESGNGFVFPPYQELPPKLPVVGSGAIGSKPDELNFGNQPYGWDGNGSDGLLLDFMRTLSLGFAPANFSYHIIPAAGVTVPVGQEMFVDQIITGPGILWVQGLVKSPPPGPSPFKLITPPQLVASVNDYSPAEFSQATNVNISAIAGPLSITGMQANPGVKNKRVTNPGPNPWQLTDSDPLSSSAAQFLTPGGVPQEIDPGITIDIFRDPSVNKWRSTGE